MKPKLIQDFACCHAVPLITPSWDSSEPELNPYVYHVLRESEGVISFGLGDGASSPVGKTELMNSMFGTEFETGKASCLTFGGVDLDTGAAFDPDRKITIADASGHLVSRWFELLNCFGHVIVHVSAKDLIKNTTEGLNWC